jgi:NADH:ubiquinone oxidoreductase subunit E
MGKQLIKNNSQIYWVKLWIEGVLYTMIKISICIGSACHLRGAHGVLKTFNELIKKYEVAGIVEMSGSFCQGRCTEGVLIKINEEVIANVSPDKVHDIFIEKVLRR